MFSNVNEIVHRLFLAEQQNYKFLIDWSRSCYRDETRPGDPWNYYFEDCFPDIPADLDEIETLDNGGEIASLENNIITPRLQNGHAKSLLLPRNRDVPAKIISKYLVLKPWLRKKIEGIRHACFDGNTLGLHLRGPGRIDGGTDLLREKHKLQDGVPYELYFRFVDRYVFEHAGCRIFAASDSSTVISELSRRYGDRIITYSASRSPFGEMHVRGRKENAHLTFSPYKLGLDILIEAYLLSQTTHLIHGNSNVTNFVLSKNPQLPNTYVYEDDPLTKSMRAHEARA